MDQKQNGNTMNAKQLQFFMITKNPVLNAPRKRLHQG